MKQLFDCWVAQLRLLKDQAGCTNFSFLVETDDDDVNVSEAVDEETGDPIVHDDHFDSDEALKDFEGSRRKKRKIKKKIEKELSQYVRDESINPESDMVKPRTNPPEIHLVSNFLDCSGYQFAKVLTPYEAEPLPEDAYRDYLLGSPKVKPSKLVFYPVWQNQFHDCLIQPLPSYP